MINWKTISQLGNNKIVNSAYVYLFLVPILAKLFSKLNSPLVFILGERKYEIVLELPFSWTMFFFSALFFTIGTIAYNLRAPGIIKENSSYGSFLVDNKGHDHLTKYAEEINYTLNEKSTYIGLKEHLLKDDFWEIYNYALTARKSGLIPAFFSYLIGLTLILGVVIQGLLVVLQQSSSSKYREMFCWICNS